MSRALTHTPLFEGLPADALQEIAAAMRHHHVEAREIICREGEPGQSLFVIEHGLAHVIVTNPDTGHSGSIARLRRGDVVGEMSLVTGEVRSATVLAGAPTDILELDREAFTALLARHPMILTNLTRILSDRLARTNIRTQARRRGESVGLVLGAGARHLMTSIIAATAAASPRPVTSITPDADSLGALDDLLDTHGTVILTAAPDANLPLLMDNTDRIVAVMEGTEAERLAAVPELEAVLLGTEPAPSGIRVVRRFAAYPSAPDVAWLGRHLSRTKLGLALGAGGAKGYAHVGALSVLEAAGYTVDCVSGSSVGALAGAWLALGHPAHEIDAIMRHVFSPEVVAAMFQLSFGGLSSGLEAVTRALHDSVGDATFADLGIPLTIMCVDLNTREPSPIQTGPIWEALVAAVALAGMFPPYERDHQRLVDGLALVPVPTDSLYGMGADITISCNIMSRDVLPAWPGEQPPAPVDKKPGSRMLETILEVMDLAQLDSSVRHAALADVVLTPRFGPSSWRDFDLADLFLAAGREAAENQLTSLQALARPQWTNPHQGAVDDHAAVYLR